MALGLRREWQIATRKRDVEIGRDTQSPREADMTDTVIRPNQTARLLMAAAGGLLMASGLQRRSPVGAVLALAGLGLHGCALHRACASRALGFDCAAHLARYGAGVTASTTTSRRRPRSSGTRPGRSSRISSKRRRTTRFRAATRPPGPPAEDGVATSEQHVATHLHGHRAGSVVAPELLEHLEKVHAGSDLGPFFARLREDIAADRDELEALIGRLATPAGLVRSAVAWFAEKAARLKLKMDDTAGGSFRLLEADELVAIGVEGKRSLWRALAEVSSAIPALRRPDYARLVERAVEQRQRLEGVRLSAVRAAFS